MKRFLAWLFIVACAGVAIVMGHANLRSIMKYIHLAQADLHAASAQYSAASAAVVAEEQQKNQTERVN